MKNEEKNKQALEACKKSIEEKLGWKDSESWTHNDFLLLSDYIFDKTQVRISFNTLKRIWGRVKSNSFPAISTLDVLAQILEYSDWNAFLLSRLEKTGVKLQPRARRMKFPFKTLLLLPVIVVLYYVFSLLSSNEQKLIEKIEVICTNPVDVFPHTVLFEYRVPKGLKEPVYLRPQYQDAIALKENNSLVNVLFYMPGYYKVYLTYKDDTLQIFEVKAQTKDWVAMAHSENKRQATFYRNEIDTGKLYLSPEYLATKRIDVETKFWYHFLNIRDFNVSCDHLTVALAIKNSKKEGGVSCFNSTFGLWGDEGIAEIMLGQRGCTQMLNFKIAGQKYNGIEYDLSKLGVNLEEWVEIKIQITDNVYSLYHKNQLLFQTNYTSALGNLKGFRSLFLGSGAIDYIRLYDKQENLVYSEDF